MVTVVVNRQEASCKLKKRRSGWFFLASIVHVGARGDLTRSKITPALRLEPA